MHTNFPEYVDYSVYLLLNSIFSKYLFVKNTVIYIYITFNHLADAFIQSDSQMRTEAINCSIKTTKTDPKLKLYKYYIYTF